MLKRLINKLSGIQLITNYFDDCLVLKRGSIWIHLLAAASAPRLPSLQLWRWWAAPGWFQAPSRDPRGARRPSLGPVSPWSGRGFRSAPESGWSTRTSTGRGQKTLRCGGWHHADTQRRHLLPVQSSWTWSPWLRPPPCPRQRCQTRWRGRGLPAPWTLSSLCRQPFSAAPETTILHVFQLNGWNNNDWSKLLLIMFETAVCRTHADEVTMRSTRSQLQSLNQFHDCPTWWQTWTVITAGSSWGSDLAGGGGAGEGDLGHQRVGAENLPDRRSLLSGTRNHVEHPGRDPGLLCQLQHQTESHRSEEKNYRRALNVQHTDLSQSERRQRRVLGGFDHHGAAGSQSGSDLPGDHSARKVPLRNNVRVTEPPSWGPEWWHHSTETGTSLGIQYF